jgi:phosphatidylinositol-3-phosphatase
MNLFLPSTRLLKWVALFALILAPQVRADSFPPIQTVFVIVLENTDWMHFKNSPDAPFINGTLLPMASHCEQYYTPSELHPSLPNYIWMEAGDHLGIFEGTPLESHVSNTNHLSAMLDRAGISWKAYQEDIDGTYVPLTYTNHYTPRHNPFIYFDDVTGTNNFSDPYGIAHIRPYEELAADLTNNTVARYNFITPNNCNNGHDGCAPFYNPVRQADTWLANEVPKILNSAAYLNNGALFITWDEGDGAFSDGPIGMIALSSFVRGGGYFNEIYYTHSSMLRTMQEIFGVMPLLRDAANAPSLIDLFTRFAFREVTKLNNGDLRFTVEGVVPGRTNYVQASSDLIAWNNVSTNISMTNSFSVVLTPPAIDRQGFYRIKEEP